MQTVRPTANYPQQLCFSDLTLTQLILMSFDLQVSTTAVAYLFGNRKELRTVFVYCVCLI